MTPTRNGTLPNAEGFWRSKDPPSLRCACLRWAAVQSIYKLFKVILADGRWAAAFAHAVEELLGAEVKFAKCSELHTFAVMPQRWVVERSFAWIDKCRCLWKNCERKLNTSLQFILIAFLAPLLRRS
jgi:transposase